MVNQEEIPWFLACDEPHNEWSCTRDLDSKDGEGSSGFESMNFVDDGEYICGLQQNPHVVMDEQMRRIKERSMDVASVDFTPITQSLK
jgi:hypothetical protein